MFLSIAQAPAAQESQPEEFRALLYKRLDEKDSAPFQDAALYLRWFFKPNLLSWNEERDLAMRKIAADILRGSPPAESLPAFGFDRMENQDGILTNLSFSIAPSFLNGEKAVFAFFKTTCGYCERELKELDRYRSARLGTETDASPMNMVGIGLPSGLPEIFDNLESFHQKLELGFPLFKANDKRIMAAYRIRSVPLLILFNEQGKPESTVHFPNQANLGKKLRIILDSFNDGTLQDLLAFANDSKAVQADNSVLALADSNSIFADFYTDPACESCTDFLDNELAAMEKSLGVRFSFTSHDIMDSNSLSRLSALMVSLFELACTGQVYLPVIAWMVRKGESSRGLGLLALYNTGFILPLAALFLLAWSGRAIKPVADWFESRVWLSKFLLAAILMVFLVLQLLR